jgi:hypothetical protein
MFLKYLHEDVNIIQYLKKLLIFAIRYSEEEELLLIEYLKND